MEAPATFLMLSVMVGVLVPSELTADRPPTAEEVDRDAVEPLAEANNAFAIDVNRQLAHVKRGSNLLFSPYS